MTLRDLLIAVIALVTGFGITFYLRWYENDEEYYTRYIDRYSPSNTKSLDAFYDSSDKRQGVEQTFFENGNIRTLGAYENGVSEGFFISFFENGNVNYKCEIRKGKVSGEYMVYAKNNMLYCKLNYDNDLLNGEAVYYDTIKKVTKVERYRNNVLEKTETLR